MVKDRLEWLFLNQRERFYQYKDALVDAIQQRERGKLPKVPELRRLTLGELKDALRSAKKLYS